VVRSFGSTSFHSRTTTTGYSTTRGTFRDCATHYTGMLQDFFYWKTWKWQCERPTTRIVGHDKYGTFLFSRIVSSSRKEFTHGIGSHFAIVLEWYCPCSVVLRHEYMDAMALDCRGSTGSLLLLRRAHFCVTLLAEWKESRQTTRCIHISLQQTDEMVNRCNVCWDGDAASLGGAGGSTSKSSRLVSCLMEYRWMRHDLRCMANHLYTFIWVSTK
jgi:hypothetical protein